MKSALALSVLLAAPLTSTAADYHSEHLIPAGAMIQCTLSEPKLSSKTESIGDPVMCRLSRVERYGRTLLPYDSFLVGRFEDYRDPGHFVGKGWMELKFDHIVVEPDTTIPLDARVVDVPGYSIDRQGRILGKGHPVRDTIEWMIPILWPLDLINLPRRGPRPTLKEETRLTLKVMDDVYVPEGGPEPERDPYGLMHRPSAENDPPPPPEPAPAPQQSYAQPPPAYYPQPVYMAPPIVLAAAPMYVMVPPMYVAPPVVMAPPAMYMAPQAMYAAPSAYAYASPPQMAGPSMWGAARMTIPARSVYGY